MGDKGRAPAGRKSRNFGRRGAGAAVGGVAVRPGSGLTNLYTYSNFFFTYNFEVEAWKKLRSVFFS